MCVLVQELCIQYWPSTKNCPEKMGDLTVEFIEEGNFEDYITRDLKLTEVEVSKTKQNQKTTTKKQTNTQTRNVSILLKCQHDKFA